MRPSWLAPVVLALSVDFSAEAATPLGVNYQGFLVDSVGNPVNGQVDILLSVWTHPTSTSPVDLVYQEIHLDKLVVDGVYDVVLGNGSFPSGAFGSGLFAGADRWLQVQIEAEILTPRQKLQSVVYALQADVCSVAANATRFDGLSSASYQRTVTATCPPGQSIRAIASDGLTVTCEVDDLGTGDITDVGAGAGLTGGGSVGAVSLAIATGGVTSAHIADGVIANVDVAAGAAIDPLKVSGTAGIRNFGGVQTFDGSTFAIDATLNRVGVGTAVPGTPLDVVGQIRTTVPVAVSPSLLRWASVPGSAFQSEALGFSGSTATLRTLAPGFWPIVAGGFPSLDSDLDGIQSFRDNCPFAFNQTQTDSGGIDDMDADGIGDACQCGDVDDDGIVDLLDVVAYRASLADPVGDALSPAGVSKCSVIDSAGPCEILDVSVTRRVLFPLLPDIEQVCSAANP